jgi:hypothetical protein
MHTPNTESCILSFENEEDMDRAFEQLIYKINGDFAGVSENSIMVSKEICEILEKNNVKYKHNP